MASNPQFATTVQTPGVILNTTSLGIRTSGATATSLLITGSAGGTKVTQISAKAHISNTASQILIFLTDGTGSSATCKLYDEITLTATTASTTAVSARSVNTYTDLQLASGQAIYVSSTISTGTTAINVFASAGDF
jgi:hypothetical protein